jgi:hypothetical protein
MSSDILPSRLQCRFAAALFVTLAAILTSSCSQGDGGNDTDNPGIESEAEARTIVTDNVRLVFPGNAAITPENSTLTPCGNYDKNAIGEGPPWSVGATQYLAGPDQVAESIRRLDVLSESGYRLRPPSPRASFPEERVYEDDRGVTIGITARKHPDRVYFAVLSATPCTIDKP